MGYSIELKPIEKSLSHRFKIAIAQTLDRLHLTPKDLTWIDPQAVKVNAA
jgi:hypothetical protein